MAWMVVRVRGGLHARGDIVQTMHFLHLTRPNHATVVPEDPEFRGMLTKVQGYVTWGEVDQETLTLLLKERARDAEGRALTGTSVGEDAPQRDLPELAKRAMEVGLSRVAEVRPLLRLNAPKGGWRSTKKPFAQGGALGYRGTAINDLARRMV
jgi:large subunit ribosomal protein L30